MIKITGLDQLSDQLDEAQKALSLVEGEIATVNFDPSDPASIEVAIQTVNDVIDEKLGAYADNFIIGPLIQEMRESYREAIIEKASQARLEGSIKNDE